MYYYISRSILVRIYILDCGILMQIFTIEYSVENFVFVWKGSRDVLEIINFSDILDVAKFKDIFFKSRGI